MSSSTEPERSEKISICVSIKNRCNVNYEDTFLQIFPKTLESIKKLSEKDILEVVIVDFISTDTDMKNLVSSFPELSINLIEVDEPFSRGKGLNIAAQNSQYLNLFFIDADVMLEGSAISRFYETVSQGQIWSPNFQSIGRNGSLSFMKQGGQGQLGITKEDFNATKRWPEYYSWGGEDHVLYWECCRRFKVTRENFAGLKHQWHPEKCKHENYIKPAVSCFNERKK